MTNLPTFVTHNTGSQDFTVAPTSDLNRIGVYTVTVRSEIQVPDDFTKSSYTTRFVEYTLDISVLPCQVLSFTASPAVTDVYYTVGQATAQSGNYGFVQDPACGYAETLTVTGVPAYATHNQGTKDFTVPQIFTNDGVGAYTVTVRNEIEVPDDAL